MGPRAQMPSQPKVVLRCTTRRPSLPGFPTPSPTYTPSLPSPPLPSPLPPLSPPRHLQDGPRYSTAESLVYVGFPTAAVLLAAGAVMEWPAIAAATAAGVCACDCVCVRVTVCVCVFVHVCVRVCLSACWPAPTCPGGLLCLGSWGLDS
mgnify:CR=1 FL=1